MVAVYVMFQHESGGEGSHRLWGTPSKSALSWAKVQAVLQHQTVQYMYGAVQQEFEQRRSKCMAGWMAGWLS